MESREPRIKQRILVKMVHDMKMDSEEIVRVMAAFDDLSILKKRVSDIMRQTNKRTFELNKTEYAEKMQWINEYMNLKGMNEYIFTDLENFEISSDDYDYYYERKTPTQYKQEEEERKSKKLGTKPAESAREPGDE